MKEIVEISFYQINKSNHLRYKISKLIKISNSTDAYVFKHINYNDKLNLYHFVNAIDKFHFSGILNGVCEKRFLSNQKRNKKENC